MKKTFIIIFAFVACCYSKAQVKTSIFSDGNAFKEFPFLNQIHKEEIPLYEMPTFNLDSVIKEENELREIGGFPFRFGYAFNIDYGMEYGKWLELEDKKIWSIRFVSKGAYNITLKLSDMRLNNNAELYIYNYTGTFVYGPVTYRKNSTDEFNSMITDIIAGEEVIIQIIEPKNSTKTSTIRIKDVVHGFENLYKNILFNTNKEKGDRFQETELSCHNDVMCYPEYENLSRGVAKLTITRPDPRYYGLCSGALLNNVRGNNRPYLLTAFHCADYDSDGALNGAEKSYIQQTTFKFNYKKICNSNSIVSYVSGDYAGCYFRAAWQPTDFLLVEIKDAITDPNIRFLGWDVNGQNPSPHNPVVGIHHPNGDCMKVSLRTGWVYTNGDHFHSKELKYPRDHFWDVIFHNGAVEGGSSGSPLFRKYTDAGDEYRVIGQFGFMNEAICPPDQLAKYGTLDRSRDGGGTPDTRLRDWLYPDGFFQYTINSAAPNQSFTFENKTLTNYERIVSKNIILQNVTINSGATLLLQATESITIGPNVVLKTGGTLITEGRLLINSMYTVEAGASFVVK